MQHDNAAMQRSVWSFPLGAAIYASTRRRTDMGLRDTYRRWSIYFETVTELNRCSDRSLADLGIKREYIKSVARAKARGF
jgi:uncharacterized protein YjiS (DUF1127 family)